jgi:hypothetical protein
MASVIWRSTASVWIGRLGLTVIAGFASVALVQDIAEIL